jgi:hypothetical protein
MKTLNHGIHGIHEIHEIHGSWKEKDGSPLGSFVSISAMFNYIKSMVIQ